MKTEEYTISDDQLVGKVSVPGLAPDLERTIIALSQKFGIGKAELSRMMLREGAKVIEKKKALRIMPTC